MHIPSWISKYFSAIPKEEWFTLAVWKKTPAGWEVTFCTDEKMRKVLEQELK